MQTLSKDAEEKVIAAVKRAVSLVDAGGLEPSDAIEKVAREESFGPPMIRFASHAYNTGRQTAQRESSGNALDKFAEFPLADAEEVIGRIWPAKVKTAAEITYEGVSAEYSRTPAWLEPRARSQRLAHVKESSAKLGLVKTASAEEPKKVTLDIAMKESGRLKRAAAEARSQSSYAYESLVSRMGQLADYFRKSARDREDFGYVEKAASVYFGKSGTDLLDWVYSRNKMGALKIARAADTQWGRSLFSVDFVTEPWNHISACIELAREVNEKRAAEAKVKEASDLYDVQVLRPFVVAPSHESPVNSLLPIPESLGAEKDAVAPLKLLDIASDTKNLLGEAFEGGNESDPVNSAYEELEDPAHTAKLQQIRTQAMLSGMLNDDVIGSYNPESVLQTYNELSQLAPRAATQPVVMRSQLRRHLQGNVQPFENNEALNIEKGIKDTYQPVPDMAPGAKPALAKK
jgi:hypothetical protein